MTTISIKIHTNHPSFAPEDMQWSAFADPLDDDILLIHNGLPYLSKLPALMEPRAQQFTRALVTNAGDAYTDANHRNNGRLNLSDRGLSDDLTVFHPLCESTEATFVQIYQKLVNQHVRVRYCSGYELLQYRPGEFFNCHVDFIGAHPTFSGRQLSVVAFCNDDFEGGELFFPRQKVKIRPERGGVVLFPSSFTHPHASLPVRSGTKYSVVTWYH
jgi:hypothetical protein